MVGCRVAEHDVFAGEVAAEGGAAVFLAGFGAGAVCEDGGVDVCGAHLVDFFSRFLVMCVFSFVGGVEDGLDSRGGLVLQAASEQRGNRSKDVCKYVYSALMIR